MSMEQWVYPSTYVKEDDFSTGNVLYTTWTPRMRYAWDEGVAIGRFLAELKEGRIVGRRCNRCRRVTVPPRMFCEHCFRPTDEWVYLKDTGTVVTFSLCYITWDMRRADPPEMPAVIAIDGTNPHVGFMHHLGDVDPKDVKIGMRVKAVWKPAEEREGAITDILYFKPIEE